jgi:acetyl-CoA C-acetyltransferase
MTGPLTGLRIVELAGIGPAPFAAMMLADHGAEVIRIERSAALDDAAIALRRRDVTLRSRTIVALDLKTEQGLAHARKLLSTADGLIEGFRPGVMERLGLGPAEALSANARLVYGRMTGWGQTGPRAPIAGHDINYIALSGALHAFGREGGKPTPPINMVGDFGGGAMMLAFGMVCALLHARRTGVGQVIDCAMTDGSALLMSAIWSMMAVGMWRDERGVNLLDSGAHFYDSYETKDGRFIALGAIEPQFYALLRAEAGLTGAEWDDHRDPACWAALKPRLAAIIRTRTRDEWSAATEGSDACVTPVLSMAEAPYHPHNVARETFLAIDGVMQPAPAPRYSHTPPGASAHVGRDPPRERNFRRPHGCRGSLGDGAIMTEAWIIDAVRTPRGIGKAGKGALAGLHPQMLAATVLAALVERNGIDSATIDDVIWGTSAQRGAQGNDLARMSLLDAGYDIRVSGVTLDRFCGSGISAVALAAGMIGAGLEELIVAGGTEMMSLTATIAAQDAARGEPPMLMDAGNLRLRARHPQSHQGVCADAIATIEGISRADVDALALESQRRAAVAIAEDRFARSLVPVRHPDGSLALDHDEFPRPGTTAAALAALKPSFAAIADVPLDDAGTTYRALIHARYPGLAIDHIHHAGNSSGVVDGAAALLLASPDHARRHGLTPRARVVAIANMGDCPTLMLNAPVPAAHKALARAGLGVADIDLWEINEAFAVVTEKFNRDLRLDRDRVNVNGGAIALGHPIGATGAILIGTLLDELERRDLRRGLVTMCAAGGMAPAIIIERV